MERGGLHGFKAAPENGFVGRGFAPPTFFNDYITISPKVKKYGFYPSISVCEESSE
jgi:hypothetical protein